MKIQLWSSSLLHIDLQVKFAHSTISSADVILKILKPRCNDCSTGSPESIESLAIARFWYLVNFAKLRFMEQEREMVGKYLDPIDRFRVWGTSHVC